MIDLPDIISINLPLFVLGLVIIVKGSDYFLDASVWVAKAFGVPQIIIGATIVSLCTTLPELVSSCTAALRGSGDMALGNAVGSIIFNTSLILGIVLIFTRVRIRREIFLVKGAFMLGAITVALLLALPGPDSRGLGIERYEGLVLLVIMLVFLVVNYYESIHAEAPVGAEAEAAAEARGDYRRLWPNVCKFLGGAVAVAIGAFVLVEFGQRLARNFHVNEAVISLVFVALGTSLPELFTAVTAIRKRAENISVGNIFGANVLNMALVVGTSATVRPLKPLDAWLAPLDIPVALAVCTLAFVSGLFRGTVGIKTGVILLLCYLAYLSSMVYLERVVF